MEFYEIVTFIILTGILVLFVVFMFLLYKAIRGIINSFKSPNLHKKWVSYIGSTTLLLYASYLAIVNWQAVLYLSSTETEKLIILNDAFQSDLAGTYKFENETVTISKNGNVTYQKNGQVVRSNVLKEDDEAPIFVISIAENRERKYKFRLNFSHKLSQEKYKICYTKGDHNGHFWQVCGSQTTG